MLGRRADNSDMANITKRTQKRVAKYLEIEETVEVAVLCEPKGTYGLGMFKLAAAPGIGQSSMNRAQRAQKDGQLGLVEDFPAEPCVLAVTANRVLAFPSNGLTFKPPTFIAARPEVLIGDVARRGLGKQVQIVFGDGSAIDVDVQPGQPIKQLIESLGRVAPIR